MFTKAKIMPQGLHTCGHFRYIFSFFPKNSYLCLIMKIFIIGTGNLAHSLVPAVLEAGHQVVGVYTRNVEHRDEFARKFGVPGKNVSAEKTTGADICIICTADKGIMPSAGLLNPGETVIHTSGSTDISCLAQKFQNCGVIYPTQTFSKSVRADFSQLPLMTEASNEDTLRKINVLANSISNHVRPMTSAQRKCLHLSAVFACNFTNHMIAASQVLMHDFGVDKNLLQPLVSETVRKALTADPILSQSGPAVRRDQEILNFHLSMLEDYPELKKIYSFVSQNIQTFSEKYKNGISRQAEEN